MDRPVTIYDIAKKVNASAATVSRVLSNSSYPVSLEMSNKIRKVAEELKYSPNMLGRQLKKNNSMTIGVIIPSISNPFYSEIVLGVEEIARKNGYHVLLCNTHQSPELEYEYLQTLIEKQVKGLIISSVILKMDMLSEYIRRRINVVTIDQMIDDADIYQIGFDYRKGGYMATSHLIAKGHRKVAFVTAPLDRPSRTGTYRGYLEALEDHGIKPLESWIQVSEQNEEATEGGTGEFINGKKLTQRLLSLKQRPTAIFACNDMIAFGVINELNNQGIEVPGEMSVIGFDDIEMTQMINPPLTTIGHPKYEMGRFACNMLIDLLNGVEANIKEIVLQPKLIERKSVEVLLGN
jgi:LacI family transcriptional regulator